MAGQSNFQDVVQLNQDTLSVLGNQIQLGSAAGSKSLVFAQDPVAASAIYLVAANATGAETVFIPDANGTLGLITAISAAGGLVSNGQIVFSNSNSISFGINASTLTASFQVPPSLVALGAGTQTNSTGTVILSNSNGLSFGMSNSSVVTASMDAIRGISAGGASASGSQVVFSNSNGVSFGVNGQTVTASVATGNAVVGLGVSNLGNTLGNTATTFGTIAFAAIGNITLSQVTAAGSNATITISGSQSTAPGGIAVAGSTATSGTVVFSNSNGISFGMNGNTVTASVAGNAVLTAYSQWAEFNTNWSVSNASISFQKLSFGQFMSATRAQIVLALTGNSNSTGAFTVQFGVYTMNGSTASLASSGTKQYTWTSGAGTQSSVYGGISGTRYFTIPANISMTPGDYMVGVWFSTSNNGTLRIFGRNGVNLVGPGQGDVDFWIDGTSASSTPALLASFNKTDTNYARTGLAAMRQPGFILIGTN